jgi:uncharacterized protein (TIGR04255 family)
MGCKYRFEVPLLWSVGEFMGEPLTKQPLVETVCEFRFRTQGTWDITIPGLFYSQVKDDFSERETINELSFQVSIGDKTPGNVPQVFPPTQRLKLQRPDKSAVIQIGSDLLAINHLQPYKCWETFHDLILNMFDKYTELCGECEIERVALRYINHIPIPEDQRFEIEQFLTVFPIFPSPINHDLSGFSQLYEFMFSQPQAVLQHRTGIIENLENKAVLLLDLNFISLEISHFSKKSERLDLIQQWLSNAHNHVEAAFIASLNPDYYESLK